MLSVDTNEYGQSKKISYENEKYSYNSFIDDLINANFSPKFNKKNTFDVTVKQVKTIRKIVQ